MIRIRRIGLFLLLLLLAAGTSSVHALEWSDLFQIKGAPLVSSSTTLSLDQVSDMRVRDIKRRLTRSHGYGADEIARMLDKKELIHALAFEEHKLRQVEQAEFQRQAFKTAIVVTIAAGVIILVWPVLRHLWQVAHVNFVVYTDRKKLEAERCWELRSFQGCIGVFIMLMLDLLQVWLTSSVVLSWFMSSKYFFPFPSIPIRPAAMMGGQVASGPLGQYGMNVGPIAITWLLRFLQGRLERWVGQAMAKARRAQKREERARETAEEKEARRARRAARRAAREEAQRQQEQQQPPPPQPAAQQSYPFSTPQVQPTSTQGYNDSSENHPHATPEEDTTIQPTREEMRDAAAAAAERRRNNLEPSDDTTYGKFEELD